MKLREKEIYKVTLIGTVVNAVLIALKFTAGFIGRSSALVADAVHSFTDFITDIIVLVFVHISGKPRDEEHLYGHGKFETLATMIIGVFLAGTGVALLMNGVRNVVDGINGKPLPEPTWFALIIAAVSIVLKEVLFRYTKRRGEELKSEAVVANAWHHRSDAISSIGTLVGIGGAMFFGTKWRILDPIAASLVSVLIITSGIDIIKPAIGELLERSLPKWQTLEISDLIMSIPGVKDFHNLRTRKIGNEIAVDVHVKMDGKMSLVEAHEIATEVENAIKKKYGEESFVNIHMEPFKE